MEKIIIACCGKYLEESGSSKVLVAHEIYGPYVVNSVMEWGHYIRGKRGMAMIAESMEHIQLSTFFNQADRHNYDDLFKIIAHLQTLFCAAGPNPEIISIT